MHSQIRLNKHAISQRKLRARKSLEGYKRLDISIPPNLWERLSPHLKHYGDGRHPGQSIVELLKNIEFSD